MILFSTSLYYSQRRYPNKAMGQKKNKPLKQDCGTETIREGIGSKEDKDPYGL